MISLAQVNPFQQVNSIQRTARFLLVLPILSVTLGMNSSSVDAEEKAVRRRPRIQSVTVFKGLEEALQQPSKLEFKEKRITLGELIQQVAKTHAIQVRIDKNLASLLVMGRDAMLVAEGEIPGGSISNNGHYAGMSIPFSIQAAPVCSQGGLVPEVATFSPVVSSPQPTGPGAVYPTPMSNGPQATLPTPTYLEKPPSLAPVQPGQAVPGYEARKPVVESGEEANDNQPEVAAVAEAVPVEKQLQLNSRVIEMFLETEISTVGLTDTNASLESVLNHALDHVTTVMDAVNVDGDLGMPIAPTHAYDLTLLFEKDHVLVTTVLAANLRKTTKVYSVAKLNGIDADALRNVITKSIRPWSWRSQVNSLVNQVSADWPDSIEVPNIKIDLAGVSTGAATTSTPSEPTTEVDLASLKAMGQLLSSGTVAAVHTMISGTEMLHYADPPTAEIEVLPGMLVVTQSQGAHREIENLLDQLEEATSTGKEE